MSLVVLCGNDTDYHMQTHTSLLITGPTPPTHLLQLLLSPQSSVTSQPGDMHVVLIDRTQVWVENSFLKAMGENEKVPRLKEQEEIIFLNTQRVFLKHTYL